ncbi:GH32 C-terminal domain-containing protein [Utexia brackfieldae]|uniref:glycoside hydrolase family 32 protein n=1 Tax=Utexia brackfieldae TaxID=3074108 RepID=UPI00370DDC8D
MSLDQLYDLFKLDNKYILLLSPQGLKPNGYQYHNRYHSVGLIGELDIRSRQFTVETVQELDNGFDFYAPQTTCASDQRRLLVGWMGLPDIAYPSDKDNWANCLTIIRQLSLQDGLIIQKPVHELAKKRHTLKTINLAINGIVDLADFNCRKGEMCLTLNNQNAAVSGLHFCVGEQERTTIQVDWQKQLIILDRSQTGQSVAQAYGEQRKIPYQKTSITLQIFLDTSSVEIFVNEGEFVLTSRIFPAQNSDRLQLFSHDGWCNLVLKLWQY